nr:ferritin-3, chloroplastic-like [Ipomoea batatas]
MFVKGFSGVSLCKPSGALFPAGLGLGSSVSPVSNLAFPAGRKVGFSISAAVSETADSPLTGVVFQPFQEVKNDAFMVPITPQVSLARQKYSDECEAAINEQINVEYSASYAYHSMYAYFDRDNVALKGLAKFFKESSEEEREHAEKLMKYQNIRGGKVKLHSILSPLSEFEHVEKGDALYAMELALSLEKLVNEKLLNLHAMTDFVESEFLEEQVEAIKKISVYVTQLRRVGKGHGVWHFDQMLLHEDGNGVA